jgi:heme-degrading monooxygenase HmoA
VEGSDTSKLLSELEDIIYSQSVALEEIASANDYLNSHWSQSIGKSTFAASHAAAVVKSVRPLLRELNKHIAWVQSMPRAIDLLHDSQFSRIFLEFFQNNNPSGSQTFFDLYQPLYELDSLISEKVNPNGAILLEAHQFCLNQVSQLWKVYISDEEQPLHGLFQDPSPELLVGVNQQHEMFWKRQKSIPVLSPNAWGSMNARDDIGLEPCEDIRPNVFLDFLSSKQTGLSFLMKEIDSKLELFTQALKQKIPSIAQFSKKSSVDAAGNASEAAAFHDLLTRIIAAGAVVKRNIKLLAGVEESNTHKKFVSKFTNVLEETKTASRKLIQKFILNFSLESSHHISAAFDPLVWAFKQSPLLSESFLLFLQEKGANVTHSSADSCHMILLDVDLSFAIAAIPNFESFLKLRQFVCDKFLSCFSVLMPESSSNFSSTSLVIDSQFNRQYVSHYFRSISCVLPNFPSKYSQKCVETLDLSVETMDKAYFERQVVDFKEHISCSVDRLTLVLKKHPVKKSELKFLKLLGNLPKLGGLCRDKQKSAYNKKIDRYASAYLEFNKDLCLMTEDLRTRIESRDNGLTKPEKVLEKADDCFQSLSKLFLKLVNAGHALRKTPSVSEFCAEFVSFSLTSSPHGVLSALLQLYRAESRLSMALLPNLIAVEPFVSTIQSAGYVLKVGSEWFYPSHTRTLQLSGWSETSDADLPFLASPFFTEVAPYKCDGPQSAASISKSLIYIVAETARRFSQDFKKFGLTNLDILSNKLRQSVACIGQNIMEFSSANTALDTVCSEIHANSSQEFTAAIVSQVFDGKESFRKNVLETHEALKNVNQSLVALQDVQFSRVFLGIVKDPSKLFWKTASSDGASPLGQLRDLFNILHAFDVKVSELFNPDGCNYLDIMSWLSHKLRLIEDWTSALSAEQVHALNCLHASESPSVQYWMREFGIQTLSPGAFEDAQFTADQQEPLTRLTVPRASNEAFETLFADRKKLFPEFMSGAEACVKEAIEIIEAQFANYVSYKAMKSKDAPKSGPIFDEFTAIDEIVLAIASNLKKFKVAAESLLDAFNKLTSLLQGFEKKMDAAVLKTQEQLSSIVSRWESKFTEAFKKYCKSVETASIHHGRLQLSQIFVDWWRLAGRSDVLPAAGYFIRILRCFDNEVISFFRPATKPLLEVRRHLISLRCRLDCSASAIEESVLDMSEILPVEKFIWPTQVSIRPSALVTMGRSQVMESRFSSVRVAAFLQELRLRVTSIKGALENAREL